MLKPITSKRRLRDYLVYDMEWRTDLTLRVIGVYDERGYRWYTSIPDFLNEEFSWKNNGKLFYAHAGGLADIQFILRYIWDRYPVKAIPSGSSYIIVKVQKGRYRFTLVDSYWLLRDKLENIGRSIGQYKGLEGYTDEQRINFYNNAPLSEIIDYNQQDCKILWDAIGQFEAEIWNLGGQLQLTIASTAMNLFQRKFLQRNIQNSPLIDDATKPAYIASRVEVFRREGKKLLQFDINSSFPASMTKAMPGDLINISSRFNPEEEGEKLHIVDAIIEVPETDMPHPPYRHPSGRIFFPTGQWEGTFTGADLVYMMQMGGKVININRVLQFEPFYDLAAYVTQIYELRKKETDPFRRLVYKYLLNSLYGKFGEKRNKETIWYQPEETELRRFTDDNSRMLSPGIWAEKVIRKIPHAHMPITAYITAYSRILIHQQLLLSDPYYCDTDCVVTRHRLPVSNELGKLKLEKKIKEGIFLAPKMYKTIETDGTITIRAKGFSRLGPDGFDRLRNGEATTIERMGRIKELMRKGILSPTIIKIVKRLQGGTEKRVFLKDGTSRPWTIKELEKKR